MIVFIQGDNGGSAEGGLNGLTVRAVAASPASRRTSPGALKNIDKIGGPNVYNHYPAAWGWAMNAPFPWYKQVASHAGGTRNGMVISWPAQIKDVRRHPLSSSTMSPTSCRRSSRRRRSPTPTMVNGVAQKPLDGISMAYSFTQPKAPSQRHVQVFEMMENVGIYKDGWMAGTLPKRTAWDVGSVRRVKKPSLPSISGLGRSTT